MYITPAMTLHLHLLHYKKLGSLGHDSVANDANFNRLKEGKCSGKETYLALVLKIQVNAHDKTGIEGKQ